MSPRCPHVLVYALAALCLLTACSGGRKEVITERKIKAILEEIDRAAAVGDADSIVKHFSKDARIVVSRRTGRKWEPVEPGSVNVSTGFTRDQYKDYYLRGSAQASELTYSREGTIISIDPGGQTAALGDRVIETGKVGGKKVRSVTEEKAVFGVEDGRVVITSLEGKVYW